MAWDQTKEYHRIWLCCFMTGIRQHKNLWIVTADIFAPHAFSWRVCHIKLCMQCLFEFILVLFITHYYHVCQYNTMVKPMRHSFQKMFIKDMTCFALTVILRVHRKIWRSLHLKKSKRYNLNMHINNKTDQEWYETLNEISKNKMVIHILTD
jgi:hypothetical protein